MHTSGLVLTFAADPSLSAAARRELCAGPFTLGEARGRCQPAVLEATGPADSHAWHDWAAALPGVEGVEVVFVHWDDSEQEVSHVGA